MERSLEEYRAVIDGIDRDLTELIERRFAVCEEIGRYKRENGLPVYDPQRERELLERIGGLVGEERYRDPVRQVFLQMLGQSKRLQR